MPMRFLILTQYYPPEVGAPQVRLSAFARALMKRGHEVEVVTALPNYPEGRIFEGYRRRAATTEEIDGVRVRRVWLHAATGSGMGRVLNYATFSATSLPALASMPRPDVVFVESPPPTLAVTGWLMAKRWGVPMVLNISDLWPDSALQLGLLREGATARVMRRLEAWAYRHADFVTAVTGGIRDTLRKEKGVPEDKILNLPNGVDTELFRPLHPDSRPWVQPPQADDALVLLAGTIGYGQGVDVVLRAADRLRSRSINFLIVGGGSDIPRLKAMKDELGLDNVSFLGPMPAAEISKVYARASIALVTLRDLPVTEGARPARTLAAMACAKPVVYSGTGEGARMVQEADAGIVVAPEDPEALAAAISQLVDNPKQAAELGTNARRFAEQNLSWDTITGRWLEQLDAALEAQRVT
jgi:glycosyltransferase involved in cell wall biosynthesis